MKRTTSLVNAVTLILLFACMAQAQGFTPAALKSLAYALGWLMMVLMGLKWILADSPNERADAKKGMMYIIIGLLLVKSADDLVKMYCNMANSAVSTFVC